MSDKGWKGQGQYSRREVGIGEKGDGRVMDGLRYAGRELRIVCCGG